MKIPTWISSLFMVLFLFQCTPGPDPIPSPPFSATPYLIEIPVGFPTQVYIPEDNPMTIEGIELGRILFYDTRLAGRGNEGKFMSCTSCHVQENSFIVGLPRPHPLGLDGIPTHHAMLPLINLLWNPNRLGWNGSVNSIEDDVLGVIVDPTEFGSSYVKVEETIASIDGYPDLFEKAFGSREVTVEKISKAIAQFVRTLISSNSKFDRYLRGEVQLTSAELKGFVLFTTEEGADCFHCHGASANPLFTTNLFYNNGTDSIFNDPADRYSISGDQMDRGAYKAPTLRNIEFTGPYMRDGRFTTLDEVIDFYSEGLLWSPYINPLMHHIANGGNQLLPDEKEELKAFLMTLSDTAFILNKELSKPDLFPN